MTEKNSGEAGIPDSGELDAEPLAPSHPDQVAPVGGASDGRMPRYCCASYLTEQHVPGCGFDPDWVPLSQRGRGMAGYTGSEADSQPWVPRHRMLALKMVLAVRETELLELTGPCRNSLCRLHCRHVGPCDPT